MGLRARLLVLVGLVSLPLLALILYVTISGGRRALDQARLGAELLARAVANEEAAVVDRGRHLMVALAELPAVRAGRSAECSALFARLLAEYKAYTTLGVTSAAGQIVCSAPAAPPGTTLADRPIFRRFSATPGFIVGEYAIGRLSGKPSLGLAYPVRNATGELRGMIFAALDVAWLPSRLEEIRPQRGMTVTLLDRRIAEIVARMARITRLEKLDLAPGISPMLDIRKSSGPQEDSR